MRVTPEARRFYFHYRLLTQLLPAYTLALISYGTAWLFMIALAGPARGMAFGAGVFIFAGLSRILSGLGFILSGIPRARVTPTPEQVLTITQALGDRPEPHPLTALQLVELGPVPYVAAGGVVGHELWLSTYALRNLAPKVLAALLLHERGHIADGQRGCAWHDLLWALAYPVAWLVRPLPLMLLPLAALHVSLWLRLEYWLQMRAEARADRWAAEKMGRMEYARALAEYLALFEQGTSSYMRRTRLRALGLSAEELASILR
jgi:hypothetical protein